ncbi:hypothetical protein bcgnr5372_45730 [Bacillus luti]
MDSSAFTYIKMAAEKFIKLSSYGKKPLKISMKANLGGLNSISVTKRSTNLITINTQINKNHKDKRFLWFLHYSRIMH